MHDDAPGMVRRWLPRRPKDAISLCLAAAATSVILVNALFMQTGPHPAPIFAAVAPSPAGATGAIPAPQPIKRSASARLPAATPPAAPVKANAAPLRSADARHDPIAELLGPSNKTMAVQRVLAEFGYGQIKPTGTIGPETKAAIEKFERERNLPVTGQVSERLTRELSAMKGGPL